MIRLIKSEVIVISGRKTILKNCGEAWTFLEILSPRYAGGEKSKGTVNFPVNSTVDEVQRYRVFYNENIKNQVTLSSLCLHRYDHHHYHRQIIQVDSIKQYMFKFGVFVNYSYHTKMYSFTQNLFSRLYRSQVSRIAVYCQLMTIYC